MSYQGILKIDFIFKGSLVLQIKQEAEAAWKLTTNSNKKNLTSESNFWIDDDNA